MATITINLTKPRELIGELVHNTPCTILRSVDTYEAGVPETEWLQVATSTCSVRLQDKGVIATPTNDAILNQPREQQIRLPIDGVGALVATWDDSIPSQDRELRKGDRLVTQGRTYQIGYIGFLSPLAVSRRVPALEIKE